MPQGMSVSRNSVGSDLHEGELAGSAEWVVGIFAEIIPALGSVVVA